jgi:hypothetical protein
MTCISNIKPRRRLSAKLAVGIAISAFFAFGTFVASASAADHRDDHRGRERHDYRGGGGYYAPPPVVYGAPYYAPPPVVYGPAVGVYMPGISIGIR